jgi:hypothetical protein
MERRFILPAGTLVGLEMSSRSRSARAKESAAVRSSFESSLGERTEHHHELGFATVWDIGTVAS